MVTVEGGEYYDRTIPTMTKAEEILKHQKELDMLNLSGNPHNPKVLDKKHDLEKRIAGLKAAEKEE